MIITKKDMSPGQARRAISAMRSGDCLIYHVGNLQADRQRPAIKLDQLGKFMLAAGVREGFQFSQHDEPIAGLGLGELTQRKVNSGVYEYIFTKS
ncbi:hypothetical protein LCGC14_1826440 [marine sediment metagenome]|uniref:Uncharacterized protein n=1 Tax=marine sediment metagenome TaxID=412755 RepID=A0A0F9H5H1_9ZZZZ